MLTNETARVVPAIAIAKEPSLIPSQKHSFESIYQQIRAYEDRIQSGQRLSFQDLLNYQVKAARFGLCTELVSKVAESFSSTVKKLQANQ